MNTIQEESNWFTELKTFFGFLIETYLIIIVIQLVSDNVKNTDINWINDFQVALCIAIILYFAKCFNKPMQENISQGIHYYISGVFLNKYLI